MRFLGIDYGAKRVGVSLSDEEGRVAFPFAVLINNKDLLKKIVEICAEEKIDVFVIGESRDYKQKENPIMRAARPFAEKLAQETKIPIYFESEVLTSVEARRIPHKEEKSRKPARHEPIDASAAALILQSFLDKKNKN